MPHQPMMMSCLSFANGQVENVGNEKERVLIGEVWVETDSELSHIGSSCDAS